MNKLLAAVQSVEIEDFTWNERTKTHEFIDVKIGKLARIDEDGFVCVSAEDDLSTADYYGEFRGGYPWIHPKLEKLADDLGMYWDWKNPGEICLND